MFPTLSFANSEFSSAQMGARSAKAAGALAAAGIKDGDTIAIMMRNEPALMDVMLAARQLGAYFTPLNWHFKSEEAGYILQDCGAKILVVHADLLPQGPRSRSSRNSSAAGCARPIQPNASSYPKRSRKSLFAKGTYVPWGEWVQPTAFRKNIRGVLQFVAPIFWNVRVT